MKAALPNCEAIRQELPWAGLARSLIAIILKGGPRGLFRILGEKNGWLRAMMPVLMNLFFVALSQRDNNWNREAEH